MKRENAKKIVSVVSCLADIGAEIAVARLLGSTLKSTDGLVKKTVMAFGIVGLGIGAGIEASRRIEDMGNDLVDEIYDYFIEGKEQIVE